MTLQCPWAQTENGWPGDESSALDPCTQHPRLYGRQPQHLGSLDLSPPPRRHSHTAAGGELRLSAPLRQELHLLGLDGHMELWLVPRIVKGGLSS